MTSESPGGDDGSGGQAGNSTRMAAFGSLFSLGSSGSAGSAAHEQVAHGQQHGPQQQQPAPGGEARGGVQASAGHGMCMRGCRDQLQQPRPPRRGV